MMMATMRVSTFRQKLDDVDLSHGAEEDLDGEIYLLYGEIVCEQ